MPITGEYRVVRFAPFFSGRDSQMFRCSTCVLFALTAMAVVGCLGPAGLRHTRARYNAALKRTNEEELLLNLVRMRYDENPTFLDVSGITTQFTAGGTAGVNAEVAKGTTPGYFGRGDVSVVDRPTTVYTPQKGADFSETLLQPIDIEVLAILSTMDWDLNRVLRLAVKRINGIENAESGGGPVPEYPPEFAEFHMLTQLLEELRDANMIELTIEEQRDPVCATVPLDKPSLTEVIDAVSAGLELNSRASEEGYALSRKKKVLSLRVAATAEGDPRVAQLRRLLRLTPGRLSYPLVPDAGNHIEALQTPNGMEEIHVATRSILDMMFLMSKGVRVPAKHVETGVAAMTCNFDGIAFDWAMVVGDLLSVCVSKHRPNSFAIALKYRDHWYYVADDDHASKRTLMLFSALFQARSAGAVADRPVLTLPVGP